MDPQTSQPPAQPPAQPQTPPEPLTQETPPAQNKKRRLLVPFLIMLSVLLVSVGAYTYYKNSKTPDRTIPPSPPITPDVEESTPTTIPFETTKVTDSVEKVGWKEFKGEYYEVSFPKNWSFKGPIYAVDGFSEAISIISPTGVTALQIGTRYSFPHGFGPEYMDFQFNDISVKIGNTEYAGEETIIEKQAAYSMITADDLLVTFEDNNYTQEVQTVPIEFIFGNDYPLLDQRIFNLSEDMQKDALSQYEQDKQVIFQILSTFEFVGEEDNSSNASNNITGSIMLFRGNLDSSIFKLSASSTNGEIIDVKIWTDVDEASEWEPYGELKAIPFGEEIYSEVFVQFRDSQGNISDTYSEYTSPKYSPADPIE